MQLSSSISLLWYFTISLDIILAVLVVRRRAIYEFPFFTFFILVTTVRSVALWTVYQFAGYTSRSAFYVAWLTQALLLITRGAVCAELCWWILKPFSGLWSVVRQVLGGIGVSIVIYAAVDSLRAAIPAASSMFGLIRGIPAAERGLELAIAVVLTLLLLAAIRYRIVIARTPLLLVTGLCFYSLIQTINTASPQWLNQHLPFWNSLRMVSFQLTLSLWIYAFAQGRAESVNKPVEMVPELYVEHAGIVTQKLQALDEELEEIARR